MVPEQEGEGEEVRGQSEEQCAVAAAGTVSGITWCAGILLFKNKLRKKGQKWEEINLTRCYRWIRTARSETGNEEEMTQGQNKKNIITK